MAGDGKTTVTGTIEEFQGRKMKTPITYTTDAEQFSTVEVAKQAGEWPNEGNILKDINTQWKNAARSAEYQKQTKTLRELYEQTSYFAKQGVIDSLKAAKAPQSTIDTVLANLAVDTSKDAEFDALFV
jgi:hypothetical protein